MFESFATQDIECGDAIIHCRSGGRGAPLLLLHGFPQTHVHWHRVAPLLMDEFTLVIPDLRGYGASLGPEPDSGNINYSKRAMAGDMVCVMEEFGYGEFSIASHDRGARVAHRLALDHPDRVSRLVSLDTLPTLDIWESLDMADALHLFHWTLLAQPAPLSELMMGADPDFFLMHLLGRWTPRPDVLDPLAIEEYRKAFRKPSVRRAMAADYRAGATVDLEHDRQDRDANRRLQCPVFVPRGHLYMSNPLQPVWERWADNVTEVALECGHFIAEELPEECAQAIRTFLVRD
ncbi:MAG: alpha/beta hydrolase [Gammaproteobacteria bacterium]|nr:alpha/beta hydrolase [Gammaproteobacteria bacterium]MYD76914.1 alpha/beta hydrolase [Gammaproteobacteria bacterium]MYJ52884.1 alpha/beta hydrolase [Gammaproteobacteria bacterium]